MQIEAELADIEEVVRASWTDGAEHRERVLVATASKGVYERYKQFGDELRTVGESMLATCRELASRTSTSTGSDPAIHQLIRGILASTQVGYVAMAIIEGLLPPESSRSASEPPAQPGTRQCGFCGRSEKDTKLVAGPAASICGPCAKLACQVVGGP
jgi:hypothetical protein